MTRENWLATIGPSCDN